VCVCVCARACVCDERPLPVHFLKYLSAGGRWSAVLESVSERLPVSWDGPEAGTIPVDLGATFSSHSRRGCQEAGNVSLEWPTLPVIQHTHTQKKAPILYFFPVFLNILPKKCYFPVQYLGLPSKIEIDSVAKGGGGESRYKTAQNYFTF
jgi:hypothetical protein